MSFGLYYGLVGRIDVRIESNAIHKASHILPISASQ